MGTGSVTFPTPPIPGFHWGSKKSDKKDTKKSQADSAKDLSTKFNDDGRLAGYLLDPALPGNPPFDSRLQTAGSPGGITSRAPLYRGQIALAEVEATPITDGYMRLLRYVRFLFNPSNITQSYQFNQDAPNGQSINPYDQSASIVAGQTLTYSLLFDRTYELAYGGSGPASEVGVLADIGAMENLVRGNFGKVLTATGVIVTFGMSAQGRPWSFYGWITGMDVTYTDFNHNMIPYRCGVNVTISRRMAPISGGIPSATWSPSTETFHSGRTALR